MQVTQDRLSCSKTPQPAAAMAQRRLSDSDGKMEEGLLLQPIGTSPILGPGFAGRPSSTSPVFGREGSPIGLSPRKSSLRKSSGGSVHGDRRHSDRRHSDGSEGRRKSSMRKGSAGSVSDEKRRVSFPENERDVLGEADWDYDRTPIEVDFDGCFSR